MDVADARQLEAISANLEVNLQQSSMDFSTGIEMPGATPVETTSQAIEILTASDEVVPEVADAPLPDDHILNDPVPELMVEDAPGLPNQE